MEFLRNNPGWDKGRRTDGTFSRDDFTLDEEPDVYTCSDGNILKITGHLHGE